MEDQITFGIVREAAVGSVAPERVRKPREDWAVSLDEMAKNGDDRLLDAEPLILTQVEKDEWDW